MGSEWYLGATLYFDRIRGWPYCLSGGHGLVNFTDRCYFTPRKTRKMLFQRKYCSIHDTNLNNNPKILALEIISVRGIPTKHRYFATFHSADYGIFPASIAMKNNCLHQTSYGEEDHQCMVSSFYCIEERFFDMLRYRKCVFVGTWKAHHRLSIIML